MPSVGTRRSTRVFVPKTVTKTVTRRSTRSIRSEKAGELLRAIDGGAEDSSTELPWLGPDSPETCSGEHHLGRETSANAPLEKRMYGIVYFRKRRRNRSSTEQSSSGADGETKYGKVFTRNKQRKKAKVSFLVEETEEDVILVSESGKRIERNVGIWERDLWLGSGEPVALAVLVELPMNGCSGIFSRFLASVVRWMRTAGARLADFVRFLRAGPLPGVFSMHRIDFLLLRRQRDTLFSSVSRSTRGVCILDETRQSVPMLSVDFAAIPFYFKSLHLVLGVHSILRSSTSFHTLSRYASDPDNPCECGDQYEDSEIEEEDSKSSETSSGAKVDVYVNLSVGKSDASGIIKTSESFPAAFLDNVKSLKNPQHKEKGLAVHLSNSSFLNSVEPIHVKPLGFRDSDFLRLRKELNDASSPLWSYHKHRKSSKKTPIERIKELKAALAEVKQNIDRMTCHANILVIDSDRCWREEMADVILESAGSNQWRIAVKTQGSARYTFKPQEMRPSVVNRFTHAYMWSVEDGWKLEFVDRWDWLVFKEMHTECRQRNARVAPVKVIPIPGVTEVSGYRKATYSSFKRPQAYIHVAGDEVERALKSDIAYYDMDSGDEEWLDYLNASFVDENHSSCLLSEEDFEKMMFSFEKEGYVRPDEPVSKERALDLCENLGKRDVVTAVYGYWLKKRSKKRSGGVPLVRIFQTPAPRRPLPTTTPFLRKKRSFKRQRSQVGGGKSDYILQDLAVEETKQRVQEAEISAKKAVESAVLLRSKAQTLMQKADLAVYKSVMALKMAEALCISESEDLASIILD